MNKNRRTTSNAVLAVVMGMALAGPMTANADSERPIRFEGYTQSEGLSQNSVLSITQHSNGYMWFATENGLNRFDGYGFETFRHEALNPGSLASDFIFVVEEDRDGNLWLATDGGGVAMLRQETGSFAFFRHDPTNDSSIASNNIRSLDVAADGTVWLGHQHAGLDRLDPVSGQVTHFRHDPAVEASLSSDQVFAVFADNDGTVWVGTDEGLNRMNAATGHVTRYRHDASDAGSLGSDRVRAIYSDAAGTLWVGTKGGGLDRFDRLTEQFTHFRHDPAVAHSLSNDRVWTMLEDDAGRFWVGTSAGLNLMDRAAGSFHRYGHDPSDADSLGGRIVRSLYQDRGGILWIGTQHAGVYKWNPRSWGMGHTKPLVADGSEVANVTAFTETADGSLWIGTFGDGVQVTDATGAVRRFRHDADDPGSLSDDRVMSMTTGQDGTVWVGTMTGGLNRFDRASGTFRHYRHDPADASSLGADGIMALFEDREGRLWVGTFGGGVSRFDGASDSFVRFVHDPADATSLSAMRATAFAQDASGAVWVGTDGGGLNRWDPATGAFTAFRHNPLDPASLSADAIYSLHVDAENQVWVGTRGGGLDRVLVSPRYPDAVRFSNRSQADGLANDVIYGIHSDANGQLWLSTNFGLSVFDPATGEVKNFHRSQGLQGEEFNFGSHYRSRAGELFFGGTNGYNRFRPGDLQMNRVAPTLALTGFDILNEPAETDRPLERLERVALGFRDDVVRFEFAALDFAAPGENRYHYLLEGFDKDWVDAGSRRSATYTNLAAGDYTLRVRAANSDGVWSADELRLAVHIAPAPWQTSWAYLAYAIAALVAVLLIWAAYRRRAQRKAAYQEALEQEVRERTRELAMRNSELRSLNGQLAEASLTDPLTGLRNRRYLYEEASKDVDLVRRRYQDKDKGTVKPRTTDLVFLMVDLDHFKPINDTYGHSAGDEVLLQIRDTLRHASRSSDQIIRWGGDEFLIVARHTDADEAEELAERIRSRIAEKIIVLGDGQVVRTTCSIGFACYPFLRVEAGRLAWEQVMAIADKAMYLAKESRNAYVGLVGTEKSMDAADLFTDIQDDPDRLAENGELDIRSSVPRKLAPCA